MSYSYDLPVGYIDRLRAQNRRPTLEPTPTPVAAVPGGSEMPTTQRP
jgi:hypothetical protein